VCNTVAIQLFFREGILESGRKVTVETVVEVYISYPTADYRMSGSVVSSPAGSGAEPQPKRCLGVLCAILCDFRRVLVHFGGGCQGK